jgi:hypothetical protein
MVLLAAVLLPFYDPIRLAEEMNVLDISNGRVMYTSARVPAGGVRDVRGLVGRAGSLGRREARCCSRR